MHFDSVHPSEQQQDQNSLRAKRRTLTLAREKFPSMRVIARTAAPSQPPIDRSQWMKIHEAGCWFWRNTLTNELTATCPFPDATTEELLSPAVQRLIEEDTPIEDPAALCPVVPRSGTGAAVYEASEFDELMKLLDRSA